MRWLVDGMNVIGAGAGGWWRDRDRAMAALVDGLERWAAETGAEVTVVFERAPSPPLRSSVVEVAHAPRAKRDAGDDEILRRLAADPAPHEVVVVTSDHALATQAAATGAAVHGAGTFRRDAGLDRR